MSWTSSSSWGTSRSRLVVEVGREAREVAVVAHREHVVVAEVLGHARGERAGERLGERPSDLAGLAVAEQVVVDAVDDHAGEREPVAREPLAEPDRLVDRLAGGRGDEHERRRVGAQQLLDLGGALAEVDRHVAEKLEEHRQVGDQVDPGDLAEATQQRHRAPAERAEARVRSGFRNAFNARPSRNELSRPGASRNSSALRDGGVSRTSRSNSSACIELVELGDRGQLLRPRDRGRQLAIDAVGLDLLGPVRVWRDPFDQLVERPLGVEHHRPQLALDIHRAGGQAIGIDPARLVLELLEPERVGQPVGGVDRHDRDLRAARRHPERDRGRRRRLADAA